MRIPLAWLNLLHEKMRTAVAVAGVAFAVILILMQLGFYGAVLQTATRVYDALDFDLVLISPDYVFIARSGIIPQQRLLQACSLEEVERADSMYLAFTVWLNQTNGQRRGILVMGVDPDGHAFRLADVREQQGKLRERRHVLMDTMSRPEFGPRPPPPNGETQVSDKTIRVVGLFTLGTGFSADGAILSSDLTFTDLFPGRTVDQVSLGLVKLKPGEDPDKVAAKLRGVLPPDTLVRTRAQIYREESHHWVVKTSVGIIFGLGVAVSLLVGIAITYQVLASDIDNRMPEYATLKAMGYSPRYLSWIVLEQAWVLAVAGFVPGLVISAVLYEVTSLKAHITMTLTPTIALSVLALAVLMCSVSGLLSLRKVHGADPADLFV